MITMESPSETISSWELVRVIGSVVVEVLDHKGEVAATSREIFGDATDERVAWASGNLDRLADQPIRLRFRLLDADLYSFRFCHA